MARTHTRGAAGEESPSGPQAMNLMALLWELASVKRPPERDLHLDVAEITKQFKLSDVRVDPYWTEDTSGPRRIKVEVKKIANGQNNCYVGLGFDSRVDMLLNPPVYDLKGSLEHAAEDPSKESPFVRLAFTKPGEVGHASFPFPEEWVKRPGPRWVLVFIGLVNQSLEDMKKAHAEYRPREQQIFFSLHPWVISSATQDEEERIVTAHHMKTLNENRHKHLTRIV